MGISAEFVVDGFHGLREPRGVIGPIRAGADAADPTVGVDGSAALSIGRSGKADGAPADGLITHCLRHNRFTGRGGEAAPQAAVRSRGSGSAEAAVQDSAAASWVAPAHRERPERLVEDFPAQAPEAGLR